MKLSGMVFFSFSVDYLWNASSSTSKDYIIVTGISVARRSCEAADAAWAIDWLAVNNPVSFFETTK